MTDFPKTLTEALESFPPSYEVSVRRVGDNGGWWMMAKRNQNGGELCFTSRTYPLWWEAYAEIWSKL